MLATFFVISPENIASIISYASDLVGNFMPLLVVVIGILIGAFIIRIILKLKD
jgi:hypothetical protein